MRQETKIVSLGPVEDPDEVNLMCLLKLQAGGIEAFPDWGICGCAVCTEHRARSRSSTVPRTRTA